MVSAEHRDENYVEYRIYPIISNGEDQNVDDILEIMQSNILAQLSPLLVSYVWEKEPFALRCVSLSDSCGKEVGHPHLHGVTRFGDNIEDEWFIVYLMYQITKAFPGSVASIQDNDGEILLIEAAHHLPKWLDPDTSKNRVFISNGELHIVPYPNTPGEIGILPVGIPAVEQSVRAIQKCPYLTKASSKTGLAVQRRIRKFASDISFNFHDAICSVPVKLAAVLREEPHLISAAVEAFYERDPVDLKACRVMKHFPPEDLVATKVKMSKIMYARLVQQRFQPDRRSNWRMPATSNPKYKAADIGMKITHGFEILASRASERTSTNDEDAIDEDDVTGVRWERFLSALKEKGFFQNELEGSQKYRELLTSAKKYFAESVHLPSSSGRDLPGHKILKLLRSIKIDLKDFKEAERHLPNFTDDSWLTITPEQLDAMLETASGQKLTHNGHSYANSHSRTDSSGDNDVNFDPELIANSFHNFVEKISSHEGVELPKGQSLSSVNFDPEKFTKAIEDILRYESDEEGEEVSSGSLSDHFFEEDLEDEMEAEEANGGEDEEIRELMGEMDRQLFATEVGKSFERTNQTEEKGIAKEEDATDQSQFAGNDSIGEEENDEYRPVEVDVNLLKNILESYSAQQGLAGPASTILHSLGVRLPPNADT